MIFVTVGTQDKGFPRLLEEIERLIIKGVIKEEVIAQIGSTSVDLKHIKTFDYTDMEEFHSYIVKCTFLITHAGVGSILAGLIEDKKVIAVARREKYDEHENEHQTEICEVFDEMGYVIGCLDANELEDAVQTIEMFTPRKYVRNNEYFCSLMKSIIG
ncbi:UDP-N-acetylglucosamine transferase subunit ALG13 [Breznakia blatticola]|uniref:UDP-N-acetylglucosamine transferase subunit ALG13 n=1 Tax=Breznakia blatticola TaxID=1754012 RepID=A0A4R7Z930_9FIRM|nr:PssE/Cps14G family polysaccharide biosynthesis glycosyltransferase [Breznakia blatticola]TDW13947.1 UDP-N-acetylglucosamine transferase subunit ALG13 [Breznakia blatticola]